MSGAEPWMKFYPQDWRADEKLRMCSLAARGLWIEMLAIMHRSERYGNLLIGGLVPTDAQLAVQAGASPDEVSALLLELSNAGVFSRTSSGAIVAETLSGFEQDARPAPNIWAQLRAQVFARDNYTCQYCGIAGGSLQCDHILPVSRGGASDLSNLATACKRCNLIKYNRTPQEMGWSS